MAKILQASVPVIKTNIKATVLLGFCLAACFRGASCRQLITADSLDLFRRCGDVKKSNGKAFLRVLPQRSTVEHHHHHHVYVHPPNGGPSSPLAIASLLELPKLQQASFPVGVPVAVAAPTPAPVVVPVPVAVAASVPMALPVPVAVAAPAPMALPVPVPVATPAPVAAPVPAASASPLSVAVSVPAAVAAPGQMAVSAPAAVTVQVPGGSPFQSTSTVPGLHSHQYHFHLAAEKAQSTQATPPKDVSGDPDAENFTEQQMRRLRELSEIIQASRVKLNLINGNTRQNQPETQEEAEEESHASHTTEVQIDSDEVSDRRRLAEILRQMKKNKKSSSGTGPIAENDDWRRYIKDDAFPPEFQDDVVAGGDLDVNTAQNVFDEFRDLLKDMAVMYN